MKILAIVGSPRVNGNTFEAVKRVESRLTELDASIEMEYISLAKIKLEPCKGCFICIERGEDLCPLKDERENLEEKIKQSDAVIFASPVYVYNVSWIMKNMLDRFAFRCHRPDFQGKKAMVIVTTGAVGLGFVSGLLSFMIGTMDFVTMAKAGVTYAPEHEIQPKRSKKEIAKLYRQTDLFYQRISSDKLEKPSFIKLLTFRMRQKAYTHAPKNFADYKFWFEKGWLDKQQKYYYPARIGWMKNTLAVFVSKLIS